MTKLKSKKMTKSTLALIIMAVAMVAMLAFGGTYAYFTATSNAISQTSITTGKVQLTVKEDADPAIFTSHITELLPGDAVFADGLTLSTAESTSDTYVAIKVEIGTPIEGLTIALANTSGTWIESAQDSGIYVLAASEGTGTTAAKAVAKDSEVVVYATGATLVTTPDYDNVDGNGNAAMGATMTLKVTARSIQVRNFEGGAATVADVADYLF